MVAEMVGTVLMLQAILLTLLLAEFTLYVWLARFFSERGMSVAVIVANLLLLALLWRLSHALGSFTLTTVLRWRDGRALPWGIARAAPIT